MDRVGGGRCVDDLLERGRHVYGGWLRGEQIGVVVDDLRVEGGDLRNRKKQGLPFGIVRSWSDDPDHLVNIQMLEHVLPLSFGPQRPVLVFVPVVDGEERGPFALSSVGRVVATTGIGLGRACGLVPNQSGGPSKAIRLVSNQSGGPPRGVGLVSNQ